VALDEYNRKRDFKVTSEPAGKMGAKRPAGEPLTYVIQKHAASRLHYDFRLELGGVLKSWSVPKGPSLDPTVKRLAVEVEDHPMEYGGFEGIIPKGQYGGGTVLLWDRGVWAPQGADAEKDLRKGELKFVLEGEKLSGGFALIKLKGKPNKRPGSSAQAYPDDRGWLLIKEKDPGARPEAELDVTAARPGRDRGRPKLRLALQPRAAGRCGGRGCARGEAARLDHAGGGVSGARGARWRRLAARDRDRGRAHHLSRREGAHAPARPLG
jgi:bifunctional non-homologous end joining protein LigD